MKRPFFSARCCLLLPVLFVLGTAFVWAQSPAAQNRAAAARAEQHGVYLVFPFENVGASPRLDWLGEGLEELTIQRLSAAGEQVFSHAARLAELERYGIPHNSKLSRATMLHIAEDLDVDFVVVGKFKANGTSLTIESQILKVNPTALLRPLQENGPLDALMDLDTRLVWGMLSAAERNYPLSLAEFSRRQRPVRLDAFEHYIRGLLATEDEARLRELREAARLEPEWPDPEFALGEAYAARRDCDSALTWFAKVPKKDDRYAEAVFATGVCRLSLNEPDRAEEVFTALQDTLRKGKTSGADAPEILNNLGIARARQGKTAAAQTDLRHAADMDPDEDDYLFNLGVLALQANDAAAAAGYFREAGEREPDNAEDRALLIYSLEKAGKKPEAEQEREAANEAFGPTGLPAVKVDSKNDLMSRLSRIKTELDVSTLRAEFESTESANGAAAFVSAEDTPAAHVRRGKQEVAAGRSDAAEKEYRAALVADPGNAAAHRGLGEMDRRQGKMEDAIKELRASLEARDSAVVRMMLARIYLEQKKPELARAEVEKALKLAPNYAEAKQLLEHLQNSKATEKKPGGGAR
jgi:tetratricopeptide (TPR) repeat protein/TolB-like protein